MALGRKTGGRKVGATNKKTREVAEKAIESGITPLEYMLNLMRAPIPDDLDPASRVMAINQRFEAAKAAAPYIHPRLAAVEHTGKGGKAIDMNWTVKLITVKK